MARPPRLYGDDFITPGMAYHGTIGVPDRMVGRDSQGRPMYQANEVVVRPATPQQGLQQLDQRELMDDARSTGSWLLDNLKTPAIGGAASKVVGGLVRTGVLKEIPTPASMVAAVHELLGRYLGNEDLGAHDVMASRATMPNRYNPYDDNPETRSNGAYVDTGDGRATYIPPSYVDQGRPKE